MTWSVFIFFASAAVILWAGGSAAAMFSRRKMAIALIAAGVLVYSAFIAGFWITLGRPPLRTTGETRLWYSFFMMLSAMLTYPLGLQVDTRILIGRSHRIHLPQSLQARDT